LDDKEQKSILLNYDVYTDIARTALFGDGTGGTNDVRLKRPSGTPASCT
jgi:spore coat protein U-like protein